MVDPRYHSEMPSRPRPIKPAPCYHCDDKKATSAFCETWRVWTCYKCLEQHHRTHHVTCTLEVPKNAHEAKVRAYFTVWVTRYDGRKVPLLCRLGEKLEMEDHWMGTYIFANAGMILVLETRLMINERILEGLQQEA